MLALAIFPTSHFSQTSHWFLGPEIVKEKTNLSSQKWRHELTMQKEETVALAPTKLRSKK